LNPKGRRRTDQTGALQVIRYVAGARTRTHGKRHRRRVAADRLIFQGKTLAGASRG
jgi:hypothetical protein